MRTAARVTCPSCDASWHVDDARFCGACGAHLQPWAPPDRTSPGPWLRLALGLVVAVAAVGGAFALGGVESLRLPPRESDPAVDLDEDAPAIGGAPLSDTERAEALAPFDEDRLRCEPDGCERWRIDFAGSPASRVNATVVDDLVVAVIGREVSAYDLDTGQQRWWSLWPDATDQPPTSSDVVVVDEAHDGIVVAAWPVTGHVMAVDRQGDVLWYGREEHRGSGYIAPAGEVVIAARPSASQVLLEGEEGDGDVFLQLDDLRVLDATTGERLWDTGGVTVVAHVDGGLVLHDGTTAQLVDARSGEVRGRSRMPWGDWLQPAGDVLVHAAPHVAGDTWQLLAADDLEVVAELGPLDLLQPSEDGSVLVGQVRGTRDGGDRVLLFEPDGRLRWEQELPFPAGSLAGCCTRPLVVGDTLHLPPRAGTTTPMQLDMADGRLRLTPPTQPGAAPAPTNADGTNWVSPHTALSRTTAGDAETTVIWHDGYRMALRGSYQGPASSEPPFVFAGRGSIIAVQPVPRD